MNTLGSLLVVSALVTCVGCGKATSSEPQSSASGGTGTGGAVGSGGGGGVSGGAPSTGGAAGAPGIDCASFEIPDDNLDAAVRTAAGLSPEVALSSENVASVTRLYVENVSTLSGAQCLSGLEELTVQTLESSDLAPLGGLTELTSVWLFGAPITSAEPLVGLPKLVSLRLDDTSLTELGSIGSLPQLEMLSFANTEVSDLTLLAGFEHLTFLDLSSTKVTDLSAIPAPVDGAQACLYLQGLDLDEHAIEVDIVALCDLGWTVTWSTPGGESGACNGTCDK